MKLEIFSVYDSKADAFLAPFFMPNQSMAVRIFQNCANNGEHQFGINAGDYTLFSLGSFDDETAKIQTTKTPISLGLAQEFQSSEYSTEANIDQSELPFGVEAI